MRRPKRKTHLGCRRFSNAEKEMNESELAQLKKKTKKNRQHRYVLCEDFFRASGCGPFDDCGDCFGFLIFRFRLLLYGMSMYICYRGPLVVTFFSFFAASFGLNSFFILCDSFLLPALRHQLNLRRETGKIRYAGCVFIGRLMAFVNGYMYIFCMPMVWRIISLLFFFLFSVFFFVFAAFGLIRPI